MSDEKTLHDAAEETQDDLDDLISEIALKGLEPGSAIKQQKLDPKPTPATALTLDPRRTSIVVIDLQKGIALIPGGAPHSKPSVIANCARLLAAARAAGAQPVLVHVGGALDGADRLHTPTDQPMRSPGALPPDWTELLPELDQQPSDVVILKRQWGAFYGTDLDLQLRRRGLTTIILCGIATEAGVESTARDAYERGYELILAEDAMTGLNAESHANSVERIFRRLGRVRSTAEILAAFHA
ncbi:MAG: hydrolase [Terracidiphilus sp.]|jgi:nicotinamidase-related amidase